MKISTYLISFLSVIMLIGDWNSVTKSSNDEKGTMIVQVWAESDFEPLVVQPISIDNHTEEGEHQAS